MSWAFPLPLHDVVSGTAVDYMHCICEGAVDQHLNAWFEDKSSNQYLGMSLKELDIAFLSIKPISSLSDWNSGRVCIAFFYTFKSVIHSSNPPLYK